jgi:hypothetical protein
MSRGYPLVVDPKRDRTCTAHGTSVTLIVDHGKALKMRFWVSVNEPGHGEEELCIVGTFRKLQLLAALTICTAIGFESSVYDTRPRNDGES